MTIEGKPAQWVVKRAPGEPLVPGVYAIPVNVCLGCHALVVIKDDIEALKRLRS